MITRRQVLTGSAGFAALTLAGPVWALDEDAALAHVNASIDDIVSLMADGGDADQISARLLGVMEERLALPSVARFVLGRAWRDLSDQQQTRFTQALAGSVARSYARQFSEFKVEEQKVRQTIFVERAVDAGRKGILVETQIRPPGFPVVDMDYLVSDRPGKVAIVDVVIEGVSMAVTQRDIVGGMLNRRGGDVEKLIADLDAL
ncbi:MAG: ABC transporter substrate-binding protein [Pseudomonadota bacterium]